MSSEPQSAPSPSPGSVLEHTAEVVAAYVGNNTVPLTGLSELIQSVHAALERLGRPPEPMQDHSPQPPVPIRRSITPDHLISLEDGLPYKSLRRHLATRGLTPEQYRAKWGLRPDYPMVAPNYSKQRSELARTLGLGRKREKTQLASRAEASTPKPASKRGTKTQRG